MQGPQAYGRTAAEDAGFEAAFLANELGRPVRVQWTRQEETGWDTKGPAYAINMRGALDARGQLSALDYDARAADFNHVGYNEFDTVLIAQLIGQRKAQPARGRASYPSDKYGIPNRRMAGSVVPMPLAWETPIRMGNLRDPDGPQVTFASESFIDELAVAAKTDPVAFRLALLERDKADDAGFKRVRSIACLKAAAEKFGWEARPSPRPRPSGDTATGRGVAYAYRSETVVAEMVEVEVNRRTGRVWVKRIACAHDCGLVINPEALTRTIEGGLLHSVSRALCEEARFDESKMLSVDWVTSPTLTHADVPERIDIIQVNGDPNAESTRPAALRRRRDDVQADAGGRRECGVRRDRRADAARAADAGARARGAEDLRSACMIKTLRRCDCARPRHVDASHAQDTARMEQVIQSHVSAGTFMGTVLVARDGAVVLRQGVRHGQPRVGRAEYAGHEVPPRFHHQAIHRGSRSCCSRSDGKLKIDDSVKTYLPDAPMAWDRITVFNLLTHTSGIPELHRRSPTTTRSS